MSKICHRCGASYENDNRASKYCDDCKKLGAGILSGKVFDYTKPQICGYCGKEFYYNRKIKYCPESSECSKQAIREKCKERYHKGIKTIYHKACEGCGKEYNTSSKQQKYCDIKCANKHKPKSKLEITRNIKKICEYCGKEFYVDKTHLWVKYDTKKCGDAAYRILHHDKVYSKMVRYAARRKTAIVEVFDNIEIFERDNWVCGLCGQEVDKNIIFPDLMSATLDHIIPLSKGGTHKRSNVQLAHYSCNCSKGNRDALHLSNTYK